ncbi:hypothetical protein OAU53_01630 [Candidatus Pelagibacter sp.]|nr:hypothetical protein [Candidatus Pelagibacter sp.]
MDLFKGLIIVVILTSIFIYLNHDEECAQYARKFQKDDLHGEELFHECQLEKELRE